MKKSRSFLAVLIVSLSYVLSPVTAKADLWDVPVPPGETFRWVFVTSSTTDATSPDISYYNDFVNGVADVATPITGVLGKSTIADIEWKAIASTGTVDAIDNIGVSSSGIYTPSGTIVANGKDDMFDGMLTSPINMNQLGITQYSEVWTGTDGFGHVLWPLGELFVTEGANFEPGRYWVDYSINPNDLHLPIYGISEELSVIPAPGALILAATGLLYSTLGLKRLRRKHQE